MASSNARPVILCVDDRQDSLTVRTLLLRSLGYEGLAALNGHAAFELLRKHHVDAAIIDYRLANDEDGETVARRIRAEYPEVRLLMLTGYPDVPQSAHEAVDRFLMKGTSPNGLAEVLEELLGKQQSNPEAGSLKARNVALRKRAATLLDKSKKNWK